MIRSFSDPGFSNRFFLGFGMVFLMFMTCLGISKPAWARLEHQVYFQDTPHELNIYKIIGRKEGPTMMIIGGIQGDEPGGFLSADLYIDFDLKRGNMIIVPRANFNSILVFDRGIDGDLNRKFGDSSKNDHDSQIVRILERLIGESDILLNLHDGWGYYRPTFESKSANPMRYGQSIIADCAEYLSPRSGQVIKLQEMAEKVIRMVNEDIEDPQYHFHFMNTRTGAKDSPYAEQRRSATYYALTKNGIPAFGVETSKNLPSVEMKVYQHNLAINAFMKIFGLEPEQPRIYLEKPHLDYLVVSVNSQVPVTVADNQSLFVNPGDTIEVVHVEANYDRGLSVDILGHGTINDFRQKFVIEKPTFITTQKDHIKFGRIPVVFNSVPGPTRASEVRPVVATKPDTGAPKAPAPQNTVSNEFAVKSFIVEVNGRAREVPEGSQLEARDGDTLLIKDVVVQGPSPGPYQVNFKGFVGDKGTNTGEDRGYLIHTAQDLMPRFSLSRKEKIFEIVVELGKKTLGRMTVRLSRPAS